MRIAVGVEAPEFKGPEQERIYEGMRKARTHAPAIAAIFIAIGYERAAHFAAFRSRLQAALETPIQVIPWLKPPSEFTGYNLFSQRFAERVRREVLEYAEYGFVEFAHEFESAFLVKEHKRADEYSIWDSTPTEEDIAAWEAVTSAFPDRTVATGDKMLRHWLYPSHNYTRDRSPAGMAKAKVRLARSKQLIKGFAPSLGGYIDAHRCWNTERGFVNDQWHDGALGPVLWKERTTSIYYAAPSAPIADDSTDSFKNWKLKGYPIHELPRPILAQRYSDTWSCSDALAYFAATNFDTDVVDFAEALKEWFEADNARLTGNPEKR